MATNWTSWLVDRNDDIGVLMIVVSFPDVRREQMGEEICSQAREGLVE